MVKFTYIIDTIILLLIELFLIIMYYIMLKMGLVRTAPNVVLYFKESFITALFWIGFINALTFSQGNSGCSVILIYLIYTPIYTMESALKNIYGMTAVYVLFAIKLLMLYTAYIISLNMAQKREY